MASKFTPAHVLVQYAWVILQMNTDMTTINDMVPIVAINDEPQIADSQETYIVYGYSENDNPSNYEIKRGVLALSIKSRRFGETGHIINALSRAFENCDISAAQVNAWRATFPDDIFNGIRFTTLEVIYAEGGVPEESEGGPERGLVNVAYEVIIEDPGFALPAASRSTLWA